MNPGDEQRTREWNLKSGRAGEWLSVVILGACLSWVLTNLAWLGAWQEFGIDETIYAHAAWGVAQGRSLYREMFFHHFPFAIELFSLALYVRPFLETFLPRFAVFDPSFSPSVAVPLSLSFLLTLRGVVFFFVGGGVFASVLMNRSFGLFAVLFTALLFLVLSPLHLSLIEIRPDSVAYALFLLALLARPSHGVISGVFFSLACWSSEKVLCYGFPLFLYTAVGAFQGEQRCRRFLLASVITALLVVASTLSQTSFSSWWELCIEWNFFHETTYPQKSWYGEFAQVARAFWPVILLTVLGAISELKRGEKILPLTFLFALLSYGAQQAPYSYSLIPFLGLGAILAPRGAVWILSSFPQWPSKPLSKGVVLAAGIASLIFHFDAFLLPVSRTNLAQRAMYRALADIASPGEFVYDNSGAAITHPAPHYYFFTDALVRREKGEVLSAEIPRAVEEREVTTLLIDFRFSELPPSLKSFFLSSYRPYSPRYFHRFYKSTQNKDINREVGAHGDEVEAKRRGEAPQIWIWGREFRDSGTFRVIRSGQYLFSPLSEGEPVRINGALQESDVFSLERGEYRVERGGAFAIVFLPEGLETSP